MRNIVVILDPAHGADVSGKCSPDRRHFEYIWSRKRVKALRSILTNLGYEVYVTTESENEPCLSKRKSFASAIRPGKKKLLLSLHNNGAGKGDRWMDASGVEVYTTPGITDADICAEIILSNFGKTFPDIKLRLNKPKRLFKDKEERFTVLMGNGYMGVLIEWLFQDNLADVQKLLNHDVNELFERSLVESIEEIDNYFGKT